MLKILYFASLREQLGQGSEELELPPGVVDVAGLLQFLTARGGCWQSLAATPRLRCAVNQELASLETPLAGADEVAFFPPVTGG